MQTRPSTFVASVLALALGCATGPLETRAEPTHEENAMPNDTHGSQEITIELAILAGGCFWGMEELLRAIPGVLDTEVGYTGGASDAPTYREVSGGHSGHAEAVLVRFDPSRISFEELLVEGFFRMHDPTTKNRQGNDVGTQYRSAIFTTSEAQAEAARRAIARAEASGRWRAPIVTEIVPAGSFTPAEDYHQDYLRKNPGGYTCHFFRD